MTTPDQYRRLTKKSKSSDKAIRNMYFYSRKKSPIFNMIFMRGSRKQCQKGANSTLKFFFKLMKGVIIGPQAKRHLNGVSLASGQWPNIECWLCSFVDLQGIRSSIAKKPYRFVNFQGWSGLLVPL